MQPTATLAVLWRQNPHRSRREFRRLRQQWRSLFAVMEHPHHPARKACRSDFIKYIFGELRMRVRLEAEPFLRLPDRVKENIK